jgi:hypothetical protein
VLFRNHEGKYFTDISFSSGTAHLGRGHGIAFADVDNDGELEIFGMMGGAVPSDAHSNVLFKRPGHNENSWITVKLVGVRTNRAAIGARIKVTVENEDHSLRSIYRDVNSGGSFGASPLEQHIGLGRARRIEALEIWWPTSKTRQTFHDVPMRQFIQIKEFDKDFVVLHRRSFSIPFKQEPSAPVSARAGD